MPLLFRLVEDCSWLNQPVLKADFIEIIDNVGSAAGGDKRVAFKQDQH